MCFLPDNSIFRKAGRLPEVMPADATSNGYFPEVFVHQQMASDHSEVRHLCGYFQIRRNNSHVWF